MAAFHVSQFGEPYLHDLHQRTQVQGRSGGESLAICVNSI